MKRRPLLHILAIAVATSMAAGCGGDSSGPAEPNSVSVRDNSFSPGSLSVTNGTTVTWRWNGSSQHNVTWVVAGAPNSATQSSGTYTRNFTSPGSYAYYCSIHGSPTSGMRGTVVVQ